jgi:hypothetical protein
LSAAAVEQRGARPPARDRREQRAWRLAPAALAAALALAYVIVAPASGDLAAQTYRSDLFGRVGFAIWDNGWYGGHPLPAYSVLSPPLGWLLGVRLAGALAVVAAAAAFAALMRDRFGDSTRSRIASIWFAIAVAEWLLAGRVPFLIGTAFGLGALLAHERGRRWLAAALAIAATLASPLAGAFLALAGVAIALAAPRAADGGRRRRSGALLAVAALAPIALLSIAFAEGGHEPFAGSSFWPGLAATLAVLALLPRQWRTLRWGVALYALASIASFAVATPVGGNAARLGPLFAGPLLAPALWPRRRAALVLLALPLAYWQLQAPARDAATAIGDPSTSAAYYRPLNAWLARQPGPFRIEIPFTREHWEATVVAERFPIARGWERQLDIELNPIFYRPTLTAADYRRWLDDRAIRYVALPDVQFDYSGKREAALIASRPSYLRPAWASTHWRVFEVVGARQLAAPPATVSAISPQSITLAFSRPGAAVVRVRYSRYWALAVGHGCVARAPGGWTRVAARSIGTVRVAIRFALARVLSSGARCS